MPSFGVIARRQQAQFRCNSQTISPEGRTPTDDKGQRHGHLLAIGHETDNLYPALREAGGALQFFEDRNIRWWRNTRSGDDTGIDGPTRNMASSQIACINFLLPLTRVDNGLTTVLRAIDSDVQNVVAIEYEDKKSLVEFEWIGIGGPLEYDAKAIRGAMTTSVDAFMIADTDNGLRAYLMEWKYVEEYDKDNGGNLRRSKTPQRRYSHLYGSQSSSFDGITPMDELLYEPFYQLMRQRLLADRMVNKGELGVTEAKVIAVVPDGNTTYRTCITSPPLAERFPDLNTVSDIFRATLKRPDDAYKTVCPSTLVAAVDRDCDDAASEWVKYQRERYGLYRDGK